jgi:Domain of unknown function (DUF3291)
MRASSHAASRPRSSVSGVAAWPAVDWHLAQVNIGRLRAPVDDPLIADFVAALDRINALADESPGFVWRLQSDIGNATDIQPTEDELVKINMSVWESVDALAEFVYRSDHTAFLRRRREWFERYGAAYTAMWWIPAGHLPTIAEALDRLDLIEADGPTPEAFTFASRFPPPVGLRTPRSGSAG